MAEVLLFHHVQGLTPGVEAFADDLRAAGHTVHVPDLFEGRTFDSIEAGFAYAKETGFDVLDARADQLVESLPAALVYAGFSFGVGKAQRLAQTRAGARGAVIMEACFPITGDWAFGPWPEGVPAQIHGAEGDEFFGLDADIEAAREIAATVPDAELFVYPGDAHLFTDRSLPSYDEEQAGLVLSRVLEFLARV